MPGALIRFGSPDTGGATFLRQCKQRVRLKELDSLRSEAGFSAPNAFSIEALKRPLLREAFPAEQHYEYLWAIYESGLDTLGRCSSWTRVYLSSLYVYCNKVRIWGATVECDYYYALLETARQDEAHVPPVVLLSFIEWMNDHVEPAEGYDDYFCVLSWMFLRRMAGNTADAQFREVMANLTARCYSKERLSELTVSDQWPTNWLALHRHLPSLGKGVDQKVESLICGF